MTVELAAPPLLILAAGCEAANVYVDAVTVTLLVPVAVAVYSIATVCHGEGVCTHSESVARKSERISSPGKSSRCRSKAAARQNDSSRWCRTRAGHGDHDIETLSHRNTARRRAHCDRRCQQNRRCHRYHGSFGRGSVGCVSAVGRCQGV